MKVDAPGLVAAAQRLVAAVSALGGTAGVPHPPLAADPASVGAAQRLSTASAALAGGLTGHVAALVASLEHLTGIAVTFSETDANNAQVVRTLTASGGAAPVSGSAPPPPPTPPDVRAPIPPPAAVLPEALSAATHSGSGGGEGFTSAWSAASAAARDAAQNLRSAVASLPETLDAPVSTPAASRHLLAFADGLDHYADRGQRLVSQASGYAENLAQARQDIPTPQQHAEAQNRITSLAQANAASGGRYAAPLARAVAEKNELNERTVTGYTGYHANTDTTTAGDDPGGEVPGERSGAEQSGEAADPLTAGDPNAPAVPGDLDPAADPLSPEASGELASMLPQMIPTVLGAAGGLVGGLVSGVTKVPETLFQAGSQALGAATQGLSGLAEPAMDPLDTSTSDDFGAGDLGDVGGGGGPAPTSPASGAGDPSLSVAPSTGAPPTPAVRPVGAVGGAPAPSAGMGGMPMMGMPMGGMAGMGAPGGGAGGGKEDSDRVRKLMSREVPHTEDVTGRTDTNRLSAAAAAHREKNPEPPEDDDPPPQSSPEPVVRRLKIRSPKEPT